MLREIHKIRQNKDETLRRWFSDDDMDLMLWLNESDDLVSFQLAYNKLTFEHTLTWKSDGGFMHNKVDDGEGRPGKHKSSAMLVPDGVFPAMDVAENFKQRAKNLDEEIKGFIYKTLLDYR